MVAWEILRDGIFFHIYIQVRRIWYGPSPTKECPMKGSTKAYDGGPETEVAGSNYKKNSLNF